MTFLKKLQKKYRTAAAATIESERVEIDDGKQKWSGDVADQGNGKLTLKITALWDGKKWVKSDKAAFSVGEAVGVSDGKKNYKGKVDHWDHAKSKLVIAL